MASTLPRHIEYRPIDDIKRAARNAKGHDDGLIAGSIERLGFLNPMIEDGRTGLLVAGHGRLEQLQARQAAGEPAPDGVQVRDGRWYAPVTVGWASTDDKQAEAAGLVLNKASEKGGWNQATLAAMLADQPAPNWLGWDDGELAALLAQADTPLDFGTNNEAAANEIPEVEDTPSLSQPGDLWTLGHHLLLCGNSTNPADVRRLMGTTRADIVWTDPPYAVDYVGKTDDALTVDNDDLDADGLRALLTAAFENTVAACNPGVPWFVTGPPGPLGLVFGGVLDRLGILRQILIWVKDVFVLGHSDYHYRHEPMFYGWVPGAPHRAPPDRAQDTVWEIERPKASREHPTMKPVELIMPCLKNHTDKGAVVFDPFAGSGSTMGGRPVDGPSRSGHGAESPLCGRGVQAVPAGDGRDAGAGER